MSDLAVPPAAADLALPDPLDLVDGERVAPAGALPVQLADPTTGSPLQQAVCTQEPALERAVAAADRAFPSWSGLPPEERAQWLDRMADALEPRCAEVARLESLTTGAPIRQTAMLSFIVHAAFRLAAQQLREGLLTRVLPGPAGRDVEVHWRALGPVLALVPWNAPAPMAAHKAASALAAGAPVVLKPSELAPHGSGALADAAVEIGLPAGVFQLVHGGVEVGARLVADRRLRAVSFTGGVPGGRAIAAECAKHLRPAQLELGGHNPLVVMPDAEAADVATAVVGLMTTLNGQWCRSLGRLVLPAARQEELLDAVLERLDAVALGDPLSETTDMGPMVSAAHRDSLVARIRTFEALGGTARATTPIPPLGGPFLAPTLVTGLRPEDSPDEVFGPVATVHPYADEVEALAIANGTAYGLEAYVVGEDLDRASTLARGIRAGGVKVNGVSPMSLHLMAPRPAFGLSGLGVEGTVETITFFAGQQVVGVEGSLRG